MNIFESPSLASFWEEITLVSLEVSDFNQQLYQICGIYHFISHLHDFEKINALFSSPHKTNEDRKTEFGDFQTNTILIEKIIAYLDAKKITPQVFIEPTCGKGNFLLSVVTHFPKVETIIGIELYEPYIWETKFRILAYFLENKTHLKPDIYLFHQSVFNFDFEKIATQYRHKEFLILGNPPWVTNSALGGLESENLPIKQNTKQEKGILAVTGKGNFDIAETILTNLLTVFQAQKGHFAFLVKNSVIKNIVFEQKRTKYRIHSLEKAEIDSQKEFGAAVQASLFYCKLNQTPSEICQTLKLYQSEEKAETWGWVGDKFVANIELYQKISFLDGKCPLIWRQGIKHDCASVMELEKLGDSYVNKLGEVVELEEELVFGLVKSADLQASKIESVRKYTIIPQQKIGQDTAYLQIQFPKTYAYLTRHIALFEARKSSIYKKKPPFSIFGIGDYSFKPYKIAISGLYKTLHFSLISPINTKPIMLDDTCYFLGFDTLEEAATIYHLLNHPKITAFLTAITFPDAKRRITAEALNRIDWDKL